MPMYVTYTWKEKIDPHLNKPIKAYVEFLTLFLQSDNEGHVKFPEDFAESSASNPLWQENDLSHNTEDFFEFVKKSELSTDGAIEKFIALISAFDRPTDLQKPCLSLIEFIPEEESREFYTNKLKTVPQGLEDDSAEDFYAAVFSLMLRYMFEATQGDTIELSEDCNKYFEESGANVTLLKFISYALSQLAFKRSTDDLVRDVTLGDDKALFKAVTIDKTILSNVYVNERIRKAQITGDSKFFKSLGKAISNNPLKSTEQHGKVFAVLQTFWHTGLYKLTYVELHEFLESCGLIPPKYPSAFDKFMERYKPFFAFSEAQ